MEKNKIPQHIQVPNDLGTEKIKMNPIDYLVYGYMRKHMDKDTFETFVSLRTLANLINVSVNTVQSSIKKLVLAGEVKILDKKKGRNNIYEIQKVTKYFERFSYDFLESSITTPEEKGVLMAMQQYTDTSNGSSAITLYSTPELANKLNTSVKSLRRIFKQLEDKGIMYKGDTKIIDKTTGLRKIAKYVDLALICQAILFVNKKVEEQGEIINEHDRKLHTVDKNIFKMQEEINKLKEIIEKNNLKESSEFKFE